MGLHQGRGPLGHWSAPLPICAFLPAPRGSFGRPMTRLRLPACAAVAELSGRSGNPRFTFGLQTVDP